MRRRQHHEMVGRFGFKREFAVTTSDTMRDLLAMISKRWVELAIKTSAIKDTLISLLSIKEHFPRSPMLSCPMMLMQDLPPMKHNLSTLWSWDLTNLKSLGVQINDVWIMVLMKYSVV